MSIKYVQFHVTIVHKIKNPYSKNTLKLNHGQNLLSLFLARVQMIWKFHFCVYSYSFKKVETGGVFVGVF